MKILKIHEKYPLEKCPVNILLLIGEAKTPLTMAKIFRINEITYSWGCRVMYRLHDLDIIEIDRIGRTNIVKLTEKGSKIYNSLLEIFKTLYPEEDVYLF